MNRHDDDQVRPLVPNLLRRLDFQNPGVYTWMREQYAADSLNTDSIGRHHYISKGRGVLALVRRLSREHPERDYRALRTELISARARDGYSISVEISMERDLNRDLAMLRGEYVG